MSVSEKERTIIFILSDYLSRDIKVIKLFDNVIFVPYGSWAFLKNEEFFSIL